MTRSDDPAEGVALRRNWLRLFGLDELGFALAVALFFVVETVSSPYFRTIG
jgi:hypothetical protein